MMVFMHTIIVEDFSSPTLEWVAMTDDDGNIYYYDESTGATQWDPPDGYIENSSANNLDSNPATSTDNQQWVYANLCCYILFFLF
jgi:hypothetical protein